MRPDRMLVLKRHVRVPEKIPRKFWGSEMISHLKVQSIIFIISFYVLKFNTVEDVHSSPG